MLKVAFSVIRQWSSPLVVFTKPGALWGSGRAALEQRALLGRVWPADCRFTEHRPPPGQPLPSWLPASRRGLEESALLRRRVSFQAAFVLFSEVFSGPLRSCDIHPCVMRIGKLIFVNMIAFKKYREGISDLMLWLSPNSLLKCLIIDPESSPLA